ncbi:MAG: DoxX family protein [Verrucomicrobiota bacterium]|nr:DoxX family protein [Verrucomicrobiota bacterium]
MRMQFLGKYRETGLLLMRLGIGVLFIILTGPVLLSGPSRWAGFGSAIRNLGLHSHYQVWGFIGALLGCAAGALMVFGLFFRLGVLFALVLTFVHLLGVRSYVSDLDAIELFIMLLGLLFVGPGKYSVDKS